MIDSELVYKKIFYDIILGCTKLSASFGIFYLRHPAFSDQVVNETNYSLYIEEAKEKGLPTVKEALQLLNEEGHWTNKEEELIKQEEVFLAKLQKQKSAIYLKSQIDSLTKQIDDGYKRLNDLKNKRNSFLGNTCENYADHRISEDFVKNGLFLDKLCEKPAFSDEEFDNLSLPNLSELIRQFNAINKSFIDYNIQKMILQDFFSYYRSYAESPDIFYGKPICSLTINQLKTLTYSRYFHNILSNNDNIPEDYKKDPDKLIDYVNANEKAKKVINNQNGAQSIVGATKEDYEYLNLKSGNTKSLSLAEEAKKKGGSLDMKDFMNLLENKV